MADRNSYRIICSEIFSHENACQEYSSEMLDYFTFIDNLYTDNMKSLVANINCSNKTQIMFGSLKKLILDFIMCCHTKLRLSTPTLLLSFKILEKYIHFRNQTQDYLTELIDDRLQFQLIGIVSLWVSSKYIDTKYKHFNIDMLLELINAPQLPRFYLKEQSAKSKTGSSMSTPIGTPKMKTPIGKSTNSKYYNYDSTKIHNEDPDQINKIINKRNSLKRHVKTIELDILKKLNWCVSDIPTNDFFIDIYLRNLQTEQEVNGGINASFFQFDTNDINQLKFGSQMLCELTSFYFDLFKTDTSILEISEASLQVMKLAIMNYKLDRYVHLDKSSLAYRIVKLFNNCNLKDQLPFSFKLKYFPKNAIQYPIFLKSILGYVNILNNSTPTCEENTASKVPMTPITPDLVKDNKKRNREAMIESVKGESLFSIKNEDVFDGINRQITKKKLMCDLKKEQIEEEF